MFAYICLIHMIQFKTKGDAMVRRIMGKGLLLVLLFAGVLHAADRPNFLIIMADDATYSDLPLYGGQNVRTPNIDRLAGEGMLFEKAYVGMSMCVPCRSELYSGLYPVRSGVCWNHSMARPGTKSAPHYLSEGGYRVGITGKVHVTPKECFPFEDIKGFQPNCVAPTAPYDCAGIEEFMSRDAKQPFYLAVCLVVPHVVWTVGDSSHFDVDAFKLPPYIPDTKQMRIDFSKYLAEIEYLDMQVGDILKSLQKTGQADNTLVLFTSEQGAQIPGCKWTNWEMGVHTGLTVRWPGKVKAGTRTKALVQYADVLPTFMDAAGIAYKADQFDGSSFLPVLRGDSQTHRTYVYSMHNNIPEGPSYPIRSVRNNRYSYIRNLRPDEIYIEKHVMGVNEHNPYWATWMYNSDKNTLAYEMIRRYMRRPAEELYDLAADPFELHNLADDPSKAGVKAELSAELDRWMTAQKDPGEDLDTFEAFRANKQVHKKK